MSLRITVHCDRNGCDTHAEQSLSREAGFIAVNWDGLGLNFCSANCLAAWAAAQPWAEELA